MNPSNTVLFTVTNQLFSLINFRSKTTSELFYFSECVKLFSLSFSIIIVFLFCNQGNSQNQNTILDETSDYHVNTQTLGRTPIGGDTIFVESTRTFPLRFEQIEGDSLAPIVVINKGGQVKINDTISNTWGAITFENCKYIKISGAGHPGYKYGFKLSAVQSGLGFIELSSDCEAEFIKISHDGFFGIVAKKDFGGNPPIPYPVFHNLKIHDCFIEGVSEGMYLGETKTPGMEFKHVKIYNNIIRNTQRESIQIANMVEDVEIYNNTMINAGTEAAIYHMNNLQIGNNSVVNVYNNILMDAPDFGIINMGKGDCIFTNNYIASSQGVFCDNRSVSDSLAPIDIKGNYFRSISGNQIIRNMNELNYFTAEDNKYDTNVSFYFDQTGIDNDTLINNTLTSIAEIQFTDTSSNDYSLAVGTVSEYLNMGAPGGPEFFEYVNPATTPRQLIITPNMVIDSVQGGSVNSPLLLFDEQSLDINANDHAISNSWKPDYVMNETSYHVMIDLGNEHYISEINLHDMNAIFNFTVEYYDGSIWNTLFVEPCDSYNVWKTHITDVSTRYLRFSMYNNVYAAVNEIIIYGYPLIKESQQIVIDSTMVTDLVSGGSVFSPLNLFDEQTIDVAANEHPSSDPWKPYFNENNAPYYATIDMGQDYYISEFNMHDINGVFDFVVEYGDGTNWTQLFIEPCDGFNVWKTHSTGVVTRYLRLYMPLSPYAAINEIVIHGYPVMTIAQSEPEPKPIEDRIVVTSNMITDLVTGGSVFSPEFLFDEQTLDPLANDQPTSNPWKPYFNNTYAPYFTEIDLGEEYHISKVYMYDINDVHNFNVDYDDNGNWVTLFVEPLDAFNSWKTHETDIITQKIRLGMLDSPYAAVTEIIFSGYPTSNTSKQVKSKNAVTTETVSEIDLVKLFPIPINKTMYLKFSKEMIGTNHVRVMNILGKEVFSEKINVDFETTVLKLNSQEFLSVPGFYIFSCTHEYGINKTIKFIKN